VSGGSSRARVALKVLVWAACLSPLACLLQWARTEALGANPIDFVTDTLGETALVLLLGSLAMTPLRIVGGWSWPVGLRRLLGLFAFFYATLHFAVWIVLDHFFAFSRMAEDVMKRPYITVGVLTLATLIPLAATSTAGMVRRLGARRWRLLHRLAYVAAGLAVLHFLWLAKTGVTDPYVYGGVLLLLMLVRAGEWARRSMRAGKSALPIATPARREPVGRRDLPAA
jgi:sulfoxide reductase heme-binding subunit YedZ